MATTPKARSVVIWGLLDQIVSSGANFAFIVIVARTLPASGFGSIALAFEVYLMTAITTRGIAGDTLMARFSGRSQPEVRNAIRASSTVAIVVSVAVGIGAAGTALLAAPSLRNALLVLACALPALVLQDFIRQALIVQGRARSACMNDLLWAILQFPLLGFAVAVHPTSATLMAAWSLAGAVAAVTGVVQLRAGFLPGGGFRTWLREHRALWPYLLGENLVYAASSFVVVLTVSAVAGLAGLAAFRAAMTVYAPLSTLGRGAISVAVNLLARRRSQTQWIRRSALTLSWSMAPVAFVWGAAFAALPSGVGEAAFGDSWDGAAPLVLWASFPCAVGLFSVGASCGLRALDAGRHGFGARVAVTSIGLLCFVVGVSSGGVRGAFVVFACSVPFQVAIWWRLLNSAAHLAGSATTPTKKPHSPQTS